MQKLEIRIRGIWAFIPPQSRGRREKGYGKTNFKQTSVEIKQKKLWWPVLSTIKIKKSVETLTLAKDYCKRIPIKSINTAVSFLKDIPEQMTGSFANVCASTISGRI